METSLLPFIRSEKHVKLCLHLAGQRLPAVIRRTVCHQEMASSGCRGHLVLLVREEEGVPPGQLEPGLEDDSQSRLVKLTTGLDGDEDVILTQVRA